MAKRRLVQVIESYRVFDPPAGAWCWLTELQPDHGRARYRVVEVDGSQTATGYAQKVRYASEAELAAFALGGLEALDG